MGPRVTNLSVIDRGVAALPSPRNAIRPSPVADLSMGPGRRHVGWGPL